MQLLKFYGRTMSGTMAQVRRALGPDALILDTRQIEPGSPEERLNPGARIEIQAVRETPAQGRATPGAHPAGRTLDDDGAIEGSRPPRRPATGRDLLEDLGILRAQITELLDGGGGAVDPAVTGGGERLDLSDYYALIEQGVDHRVLAPHLRRWLAWRTAPVSLRRFIAERKGGAAARMEGESLAEWLYLTWMERQGGEAGEAEGEIGRPAMTGLVGPTGAGKTTTLAKMASIYCQEKRQNVVIVTLDTLRFGAVEQWRRTAKLLGVELQEVVTQAELTRCMETWSRYDWIGIDTPGGMTPENETGRRYGSILAQCPQMKTLLLLPATNQETVNREQMERGRMWGATDVIFSKLDETLRLGSLVNLTMDGRWKVDSLTTGPRVPHDWDRAVRQTVWRRIFAPGRQRDCARGIA
ncbi:MAG: hypothetical protein M1457_11885 [bacterium]|nr:hypothetical protein [bacterium]